MTSLPQPLAQHADVRCKVRADVTTVVIERLVAERYRGRFDGSASRCRRPAETQYPLFCTVAQTDKCSTVSTRKSRRRHLHRARTLASGKNRGAHRQRPGIAATSLPSPSPYRALCELKEMVERRPMATHGDQSLEAEVAAIASSSSENIRRPFNSICFSPFVIRVQGCRDTRRRRSPSLKTHCQRRGQMKLLTIIASSVRSARAPYDRSPVRPFAVPSTRRASAS